MHIEYKTDATITTDQFLDILRRSTMDQRRPVHDRACMEGMAHNGNLLVTAWHDEKLIGIARSVTDFHYACYLSELCVDQEYKHQGIGKKLQIITQQQLGPHCTLILIAAPAADPYYERIGFTKNKWCWTLKPDQHLH